MGLFDRMFKERLEWANGRLSPFNNRWVFADLVPKGAELLHPGRKNTTTTDANNHDVVLITGKSVHCDDALLHVGQHPKFRREGGAEYWDVPLFVCRKCEHFRKADRRIRYPHCERLRQQRGGTVGAVTQVKGIVDEAVRMTQEMMN